MRTYRACWWGTVFLIGGLGFLVAVLTLPTGDLVIRGMGGALVGLASRLLIVELVRDPVGVARPSSAAVMGSVSLVAAVGVGRLVGGEVVLLVAALLALSSPGAGRYYAILHSARIRSAEDRTGAAFPSTVAASPLVTAVGVRQLSDEELAAAWHSSCQALQMVADPHQRLNWVLARQIYLDEFERRSPGAFADWLVRIAGTNEPSHQCFPQPLTGSGPDGA